MSPVKVRTEPAHADLIVKSNSELIVEAGTAEGLVTSIFTLNVVSGANAEASASSTLSLPPL